MLLEGAVSHRRHGRRQPYTEIGMHRGKGLPCFRCGKPAHHQWSICSDGNLYRPVCVPCDVAINRIILRFMRFPDWKAKVKRYEQSQSKAAVRSREG